MILERIKVLYKIKKLKDLETFNQLKLIKKNNKVHLNLKLINNKFNLIIDYKIKKNKKINL